jgi:hypothetical protein
MSVNREEELPTSDASPVGLTAMTSIELSRRVAVHPTSGLAYFLPLSVVCDACPCCEDTCDVEGCKDCGAKRRRAAARSMNAEGGKSSSRRACYTPCQIRRHNTTGSAWIVSAGVVYDVTSYLEEHPGGKRSILRNCGGRDCIEDMEFHSKSAQKLWQSYAIGRVIKCNARKSPPSESGYSSNDSSDEEDLIGDSRSHVSGGSCTIC